MVATLAAAGLAAAQSLPKPGQFLVATPASTDPELSRSVVLMIRSSEEAAVGLMVNRPAPLLKSVPGAITYLGGPLPIGTNALVRAGAPPRPAWRLLPGLYLVAEQASIQRLAAQEGANTRVYLGQCGWTAGQIQDELRRGLWRVLPASAAEVFDPHPESLWERLWSKLGSAR
jgi:putative transcriptional regulator